MELIIKKISKAILAAIFLSAAVIFFIRGHLYLGIILSVVVLYQLLMIFLKR